VEKNSFSLISCRTIIYDILISFSPVNIKRFKIIARNVVGGREISGGK
jgi:hypothetical protein